LTSFPGQPYSAREERRWAGSEEEFAMRSSVVLALCALVAVSSTSLIGVARADGNADAGAADFKRTCGVCHATEAGKKKIGPTLFGIVGRPSASVPDFAYSDAMKNAKLTWTPENLDKYMADPKGMVPGNKMVFVGVKKPEERQEIIAYLATLH
jgi:cytochrome c